MLLLLNTSIPEQQPPRMQCVLWLKHSNWVAILCTLLCNPEIRQMHCLMIPSPLVCISPIWLEYDMNIFMFLRIESSFNVYNSRSLSSHMIKKMKLDYQKSKLDLDFVDRCFCVKIWYQLLVIVNFSRGQGIFFFFVVHPTPYLHAFPLGQIIIYI